MRTAEEELRIMRRALYILYSDVKADPAAVRTYADVGVARIEQGLLAARSAIYTGLSGATTSIEILRTPLTGNDRYWIFVALAIVEAVDGHE